MGGVLLDRYWHLDDHGFQDSEQHLHIKRLAKHPNPQLGQIVDDWVGQRAAYGENPQGGEQFPGLPAEGDSIHSPWLEMDIGDEDTDPIAELIDEFHRGFGGIR